MIILCGHGQYGKTMKESLEMIAGEQPAIQTVDFTMDMAVTDIIEQYEALHSDETDTVILCDIQGGSPANAALLTKKRHENVRVFTGLNLTMILSLAMGESLDASLNAARESVQEL